MKYVVKCVLMSLMLLFSSPLLAQSEGGPRADLIKPTPKPYQVSVSVVDADQKPIADKIVFLRAARVRGPFEPTPPKPQHEWTGVTDESGVARFTVDPTSVEGLRLQAVMSHDMKPYESSVERPEENLALKIKTYGVTDSLKDLKIKNLRMVVQVWEGFLTFTQVYSFINTGEEAIDLERLPGEDFEKGLPIKLPLKAKGISAKGSGRMQPVQSTVFWNYFLRPNEVATVEISFSMSETGHQFIYEQTMEYLTENIEVIAPLQTNFRKLPRLETLSLTVPGFTEVAATDETGSPLGLRPDIDFIAAWGARVKPGESFVFRLQGLPFEESVVPLLVVLAAIVAGILILIFGLKYTVSRTTTDPTIQHRILKEHRDRLMAEIAELKKAQQNQQVDATQYKIRYQELRQRLGLVLSKLDGLQDEDN